MGFYAQKKFQTAPIQAVTEPSLASNSDVNVPTIEAVNKGLSARQLLINNDFQINQRELSEYPPSEVKYTLDMWIKRGSAIKVVTNGIIFDTVGNESNGALGQKVESIEVGKKYTVCINIVSIKGSGAMSIGTRAEFDNVAHSNNLKQGINKITFTATGKWLTVCCKGVEINIEYIDLFEGDIAYPHVKKKYSEDLMECQRYLLMIFSFQGYWGNPSYYISEPRIRYMASKPTITFTGNTIVMIEGANMKLQISSIELSSYLDEIKLNVSNIEDISSKVISRTINGYSSSGIIVSCEPL